VKLWAFWSWSLNPRDTDDSALERAVYAASYVPVLVLAAIGAALLAWRRRVRPLLFVLVPIALFTAVHLVIFGYTRLRAPLDPLLMVLAGVTVTEAATALATTLDRRWRSASSSSGVPSARSPGPTPATQSPPPRSPG
jgi:hypothetical protein